MNSREPIVLELAGIRIAVHGPWAGASPFANTVFECFVCKGQPEVVLKVAEPIAKELARTEGHVVFDVPGRWALYSNGDHYTLTQSHPFAHGVPVRLMVFDRGFTEGSFFVRAPTSEEQTGFLHPNPLQYPLGEILMVCLLARSRGLMVHGCAVEYGGQGLIFSGNSGAGKSTLAALWARSARVLNDDRAVIRKAHDGYAVYPTPWHGERRIVTPEPARLGTLFFIRQGTTNAMRRLTTMEASSMLLTRSFVPLWDKEGMDFTLDFAVTLVSRIPCWELTFVSDESVIDFLQGHEDMAVCR